MNSWVRVKREEDNRMLGSLILTVNESGAEKVGHTVAVVLDLPEKVSLHKVEKDNGSFTAARLNAEIDPKQFGLVVGARVLFRRYLADLHELGDGSCLVHWQDILAIVPEGGKISNL